MYKEPKVSIIIPFKRLNPLVEKCIKNCLEMDYKNFDIILLPDSKINKKYSKCRIIPTKKVHPSEKRNIGIFSSKSEFIASIDSDAYPAKDWLRNAIWFFKDEKVGAVGGPNLPPKEAGLLEKAAIAVVYSKLGLTTAYRIKKYKEGSYECKELASSNIIYRKSVLEKVKGYDSTLPTGEDTMICFKIRSFKKKIIYSPRIKVYHHRRKLFIPHLERIYSQAFDKAVILKKSFSFEKIIYFLPAIFVLFLVFGFILSLFSIYFMTFYFFVILIYLLIVLVESIKTKGFILSLLVFIGLPLTHIVYGAGFLFGLTRTKSYI